MADGFSNALWPGVGGVVDVMSGEVVDLAGFACLVGENVGILMTGGERCWGFRERGRVCGGVVYECCGLRWRGRKEGDWSGLVSVMRYGGSSARCRWIANVMQC
jgi:hypothetical protein